ncbi:putative 37S ribosomal protein-like protein [Hapsidospora chrysogenum ATCC 11550]|uniref:Putative 37S ribosomal protein-like protein n=1 Tax=Hapsidospora chrysogenum (strain ATCC 11550 / CBS 779.69 / DSM 880 / IAM 14645 / JCM 23072 / IMI 49137) TaxID=857340 RepID=A0A086T0D2_HAPC1|nr:putative 37S ribosomal protein-like protein [Hapsidospora chrysogenum ATCC 11550]
MSRSLASRLVAQPLLHKSSIPQCTRLPAQGARAFSQTSRRLEDGPPKPKSSSKSLLETLYGTPQVPKSDSAEKNVMSQLSQSSVFKAMATSRVDTSSLSGRAPAPKPVEELEPYHLHIYSTKHNTHVTCTKPNREPIISLSCGNLGYKKSRRGLFDSAYSLTKYLIERLIHTGWPMKMDRLEVVMRGFGQGREAALKVLMSPEGKILRDKIVRVSDSTRLKFGGTRSRRPRRL